MSWPPMRRLQKGEQRGCSGKQSVQLVRKAQCQNVRLGELNG